MELNRKKKSLHGRFIQKEESSPKVQAATNESLNQSKKIEETATKLLGQITASPTAMVIPIHMKNKKENPDLSLPLK